MSSYPGLISSTDDYYFTDSGLVVEDTTIEILDQSLYDLVEEFPLKPHIPNFMHIMAVNRLANSGSDWAERYSKMNTGTYIAQWMVRRDG
jgi:hypothetical protein